ncbi:MAG: hypothetical protein QXL50_02410 [Candidatus Pacearchaeota archaeon]
MKDIIIGRKQQEDFSFYEDSIQELKELYKFILLNKISNIPELLDANLSKILIYYTARPYSDIIHSKNIEKNYDINQISLLFNIADRNTFNHLISSINFTGFYILYCYQLLLEIDKHEYKIKSLNKKTYIDNNSIDENSMKYEYYECMLENDNKIYVLDNVDNFVSSVGSIIEYPVVKLKRLLLIKDNKMLDIDYNNIIKKTKNKTIIPTNLFIFLLQPFYRVNETIWYECNIEFTEVKTYLKKLIFLNSPLEFLFNLEILTSEDYKTYNLNKSIILPINSDNYLDKFVYCPFCSAQFNSLLIVNDKDLRQNYYRLHGYIYDPNIIIEPILINLKFNTKIIIIAYFDFFTLFIDKDTYIYSNFDLIDFIDFKYKDIMLNGSEINLNFAVFNIT